MESKLKQDMVRYANGRMPTFQKYYRKCQDAKFYPIKLFYKVLLRLCSKKNLIELDDICQIGPGLYIGHPYGITINPGAIIGKNINIHKGVTIGQENRGARKGTPTIGNNVWIGVNSTIVGKIVVGDDVLIAPNSYINTDIPSHSVVFGNPCIIKHKEDATKDYINHTI